MFRVLHFVANFQLKNVISELRRLTDDLHIAVLVTNNIRYYGDSPQGCLGFTWAAVPHVSLHMQPSYEHTTTVGRASSVQIRRGQRYMCSEAGGASSTSASSCLLHFQGSWSA